MTMGEYICRECGHQFCPDCVVFPFGASKPPTCIACALELGGVRRQSTGRPKLTRRSIKQRLKLQRELSRSATLPTPDPEAGPTPEEEWMEGTVRADDLPGGWTQKFS